MANENPKLTITLTGRQPVKITKDEWPVVASANWHDGREIESQSNRRKKLIVRQNNDGRTIVYGISESNWQGENERRGGELVTVEGVTDTSIGDAQPIIDAIYRVSDYLEFDRTLADECIADLPAVEI